MLLWIWFDIFKNSQLKAEVKSSIFYLFYLFVFFKKFRGIYWCYYSFLTRLVSVLIRSEIFCWRGRTSGTSPSPAPPEFFSDKFTIVWIMILDVNRNNPTILLYILLYLLYILADHLCAFSHSPNQGVILFFNIFLLEKTLKLICIYDK